MKEFFAQAGAQFVALITFFAFPAIQYIVLRRYTRREGEPQLWFLPAYGFRLVIRNMSGARAFSELKTRATLRTIIPSRDGASVHTFMDDILVDREDFFLFPGNDQTVVSFRLERSSGDDLHFVVTDKLGAERKRVSIDSFQKLVCDYTANIENMLNFDIKMSKRAELTSKTLRDIFEQVQASPVEQSFPLSRVRDVH